MKKTKKVDVRKDDQKGLERKGDNDIDYRTAFEDLTKQLQSKDSKILSLCKELEEKNMRIEDLEKRNCCLTNSIGGLSQEIRRKSEQNDQMRNNLLDQDKLIEKLNDGNEKTTIRSKLSSGQPGNSVESVVSNLIQKLEDEKRKVVEKDRIVAKLQNDIETQKELRKDAFIMLGKQVKELKKLQAEMKSNEEKLVEYETLKKGREEVEEENELVLENLKEQYELTLDYLKDSHKKETEETKEQFLEAIKKNEMNYDEKLRNLRIHFVNEQEKAKDKHLIDKSTQHRISRIKHQKLEKEIDEIKNQLEEEQVRRREAQSRELVMRQARFKEAERSELLEEEYERLQRHLIAELIVYRDDIVSKLGRKKGKEKISSRREREKYERMRRSLDRNIGDLMRRIKPTKEEEEHLSIMEENQKKKRIEKIVVNSRSDKDNGGNVHLVVRKRKRWGCSDWNELC